MYVINNILIMKLFIYVILVYDNFYQYINKVLCLFRGLKFKRVWKFQKDLEFIKL